MTAARGFDPWYRRASDLRRRPDAEIMTALLNLPKHSRILVCLADIDGLAYHEIAQITGIPAELVGSSLRQARCQLGELAVGAAGLESEGQRGVSASSSASVPPGWLAARHGRRSEPGRSGRRLRSYRWRLTRRWAPHRGQGLVAIPLPKISKELA
jgi:hypothetical protein